MRLRAGVAAILICSVLLPIVDRARSAVAGVYNPIPADVSTELPEDVFSADDALGAYVTSDLKGGRICIVAADATVDTASCDEPAWGTTNGVVGIGTLFIPMEGPSLAPGTWRMMTEDSAKGNRRISELFSVSSCGQTCDPSIGRGAIDKWKSTASANLGLGRAVCAGLAVKDLHGSFVAARGKLTKTAGTFSPYRGFTTTIVSSGLMLFSVPDFSNPGEEKAMEILKELSCQAASMWTDIKNDPPDASYATVGSPSFTELPPLGVAVVDDLAKAADDVRAYGRAQLKAYERSMGAQADAAQGYVHAQIAAVAANGFDLTNATRSLRDGLRSYADRLVNDVGDEALLTPERKAELVALYGRVSSSGFTQSEVDQAHTAGITDAELAMIREQMAATDVSAIPTGVSLGSLLRQSATTYDEGLDGLDGFAREAGRAAFVTDAPTVASFSGTPLTGVAPLRATFTDTSTSIDGDDIGAVAWDFGDGQTATGSTAVHTFASPGTYTVTETVPANVVRSVSATRQVVVAAASSPPVPGTPPSPVITGGERRGLAPASVTLDGSSSTPGAAPIARYDWSFDDGGAAVGALAFHTFTTAAMHQATLTVTDTNGQQGVGVAVIDVFDAAQVALPVCGDQDGSETPFVTGTSCVGPTAIADVQTFTVPGTGEVAVRFDYVFREAANDNGLWVAVADDATGAVDGLSPSDAAWVEHAIRKARTVFQGGDAYNPDATMAFSGGDTLIFMIGVGTPIFFSLDAANPDRLDHFLGFTDPVDGFVQFGWEDLAGPGGDFNDIVFNVYPKLIPVSSQAAKVRADRASVPIGGRNGYTVDVVNTRATAILLETITDTLAPGFTYVPGSSRGVIAKDPAIAGQLLTWTGPFVVPAGDRVSLHFDVTATTIAGTWLNEAGGTAGTSAITGSGPTAAIQTVDQGAAFRGRYHPLQPARILDTRIGNGAAQQNVGAGQAIDLQVTGRGGIPSAGVSAVVMNVTVTEPTAPSFVTVWPTGQARPLASNLNSYLSGQTVPNVVAIRIGSAGKVSLYNNAGATHLIADVAGYYSDAAADSGSNYNAVPPTRILDTRTSNGAPLGKVGASQSIDLQVTGRGGVPSVGVAAVVMNVTVDQAAGAAGSASYLTAWPTGTEQPFVSNLNYVPGQTVPNLVVVKVGASGKVSLYNNSGSTHMIADVAGWYAEDGAPIGSEFNALVPSRMLDTRTGNGTPAAPLGADSAIDVQVTGRGGVPASDVEAVVLNVTVTGPCCSSFITVWPEGQARPIASNLNFSPGQTVPNLVVVKLGPTGKVSIYNNAGSTHVIGDVAGWYRTST